MTNKVNNFTGIGTNVLYPWGTANGLDTISNSNVF